MKCYGNIEIRGMYKKVRRSEVPSIPLVISKCILRRTPANTSLSIYLYVY